MALAAHGTDKAPHSKPQSKFLSSGLLEVNRRNAPEWSQIFSSIFSWVHIQWLLNSLGRLAGYMASESRPFSMSDSAYKRVYINRGHRHVCITSEDGFGGAPETSIQDDQGNFLHAPRPRGLRRGR